MATAAKPLVASKCCPLFINSKSVQQIFIKLTETIRGQNISGKS